MKILAGEWIYLAGTLLAAGVAAFCLWQPVAGIAEAAQFSPARVLWRFVCVLPYGLLPLAAVVARAYSSVLESWASCRWADAFVESRPTAEEWWLARWLLWALPAFLTVVNVSTAVTFVWWAGRERAATLQGIDERLRPRPNGMMASFLMLGGVFGGALAQQLFGISRRFRLVGAWLAFLAAGLLIAWLPLRFLPPFSTRTADDLADAVEILVRERGRETVAQRLVFLADSPDDKLRKTSQFALARLGSGAQAAIPRLIYEVREAPRAERGVPIGILDRIDPNWPKLEEARKLVPALCEILADLSWADAWTRNPPTPTLEGPEMVRRVLGEKTKADSDPVEYRGTYILNEPGPGRVVLRVIQILNDIDPHWQGTPEGRAAIASLREVWKPKHPKYRHPGWSHVADGILRRVDPKWSQDRKAILGL